MLELNSRKSSETGCPHSTQVGMIHDSHKDKRQRGKIKGLHEREGFQRDPAKVKEEKERIRTRKTALASQDKQTQCASQCLKYRMPITLKNGIYFDFKRESWQVI